jgi:hypothetical protein
MRNGDEPPEEISIVRRSLSAEEEIAKIFDAGGISSETETEGECALPIVSTLSLGWTALGGV